MIIENAISHYRRQPQPRRHSLGSLNALRAHLLQDPFFDPQYRTEELAVRARPATIIFSDMVVLMAKLMRVLMRERSTDPLNEEELAERIDVRNACLDQPFFDRARINSDRPFGPSPVDDEACCV